MQSGVNSTSRVAMCSNLLFICVLCHWGTVQEEYHTLNNNVPHAFNVTAIETGDFCCQRICSKTRTSCRDNNAATDRHISSAPPINHPLEELLEIQGRLDTCTWNAWVLSVTTEELQGLSLPVHGKCWCKTFFAFYCVIPPPPAARPSVVLVEILCSGQLWTISSSACISLEMKLSLFSSTSYSGVREERGRRSWPGQKGPIGMYFGNPDPSCAACCSRNCSCVGNSSDSWTCLTSFLTQWHLEVTACVVHIAAVTFLHARGNLDSCNSHTCIACEHQCSCICLTVTWLWAQKQTPTVV